VVLEPFERPTWADRMWMDQCGLAVEFQISAVPFVLRWIPPGEFLMGSPESEEGRDSNEGPQHRVTISRGFWMGETPVTQRQWRAVVQEATARQPTGFSEQLAPGVESGSQSEDNRPLNPAPSHFADRDDAPVEQVSWHDCVQFCEALSVLLPEGPRFHLPTEAEWEYACRAGTGSAFSDGSECTLPKGNDPALDRLGWFNENSENETHEVRQKPGNGWGLYDLHGNVWEWCRDANRSYGSEACSDPVGEIGVGAARVLRGGGWGSWARYCRSAVRSANAPGFAWHVSGLRLSAGQERAQSGTSAQASLESS
jgi:formylglycine-generating enzyme required for sulfatase activity